MAFIYCNKAVEKNEDRKAVSGLPYYLYYEKGSNTMTVYTAGSDGYYDVPIRTISCACGSTPTKTPLGIFTLSEKLRWKEFSKNCHAQYGIKYSDGIYLHGPCYWVQTVDSLMPWFYNSIGKNSTSGCLRMQMGHIYWIYNHCELGTKIEIVDGNPRGTSCLKPADIDDDSTYDPTDPVLKK